MLTHFKRLSQSKLYWLLLIALGVALEAIALIYQYSLEYAPCVLCIHIRIWVLAITLLALLGLLLHTCSKARLFFHATILIAAVGLIERSWKTLAVERGWIMDSCSMDAGLPPWFALDQWLPSVFKPLEPCGYTPELLFSISMAEALVVFSISLGLVALAILAASLIQKK